jgi:hypothetical protein
MDLIARYDPSELPAELTAYVRNRTGYDYHHHAEVGSDNASFVTDDVVDSFCIVGPVEEHKRRLRELAGIGVHQLNIYLMSGDEEATLDVYGREIVPALAGRSGARPKAAREKQSGNRRRTPVAGTRARGG